MLQMRIDRLIGYFKSFALMANGRLVVTAGTHHTTGKQKSAKITIKHVFMIIPFS